MIKTKSQDQKAVVLFSGGLDSTTCLYYTLARFGVVKAISFDYGQRHKSELRAAQTIAQDLGVAHHIITLDTQGLASALTDPTQSLKNAQEGDIPTTYVPARNALFLSYALGVAESFGAQHLVIGVSSVDFSGYPDCRADFIAAFEEMANLATAMGRAGQRIEIHAPLMHLSKADTLQMGMQLGVDYAKTVSCYDANQNGDACGVCDSCLLRKKGFMEANIPDPTRYR